MPSARSVRNAAILGAAGLAGVYAFEAAQYHRSGAKGFDLEDRPRRAPRLRQHTEVVRCPEGGHLSGAGSAGYGCSVCVSVRVSGTAPRLGDDRQA
jgi:hypothetical protein